MRKKLVIVGASGHLKDVSWIVESRAGEWELAGVLDDHAARARPVSAWRDFADHWFVVAIGSPRVRRNVVANMLSVYKPRFATLVHAGAHVATHVRIGEGAMIGPGATISVDAVVGAHAIVNANATIAHDDRIGDFCTIAPLAAISGNVTLEDGVEIGTGAAIRQGVRIGRGAMVGMGSVVTRDVGENECVVGNPARFFKMLPPFEGLR